MADPMASSMQCLLPIADEPTKLEELRRICGNITESRKKIDDNILQKTWRIQNDIGSKSDGWANKTRSFNAELEKWRRVLVRARHANLVDRDLENLWLKTGNINKLRLQYTGTDGFTPTARQEVYNQFHYAPENTTSNQMTAAITQTICDLRLYVDHSLSLDEVERQCKGATHLSEEQRSDIEAWLKDMRNQLFASKEAMKKARGKAIVFRSAKGNKCLKKWDISTSRNHAFRVAFLGREPLEEAKANPNARHSKPSYDDIVNHQASLVDKLLKAGKLPVELDDQFNRFIEMHKIIDAAQAIAEVHQKIDALRDSWYGMSDHQRESKAEELGRPVDSVGMIIGSINAKRASKKRSVEPEKDENTEMSIDSCEDWQNYDSASGTTTFSLEENGGASTLKRRRVCSWDEEGDDHSTTRSESCSPGGVDPIDGIASPRSESDNE
jgi:hypothetical protein